mmetsp:Transcript_26018/g.52153  ORF Transcript_26018/g.52153 Transcript_26018/m.52153 type:complete len:232 (-) Transcript_26018:547-1242(-)
MDRFRCGGRRLRRRRRRMVLDLHLGRFSTEHRVVPRVHHREVVWVQRSAAVNIEPLETPNQRCDLLPSNDPQLEQHRNHELLQDEAAIVALAPLGRPVLLLADLFPAREQSGDELLVEATRHLPVALENFVAGADDRRERRQQIGEEDDREVDVDACPQPTGLGRDVLVAIAHSLQPQKGKRMRACSRKEGKGWQTPPRAHWHCPAHTGLPVHFGSRCATRTGAKGAVRAV